MSLLDLLTDTPGAGSTQTPDESDSTPGSTDEDEEDTLVAETVSVTGSVHASGEAYLNIGTLYLDGLRAGDKGDVPISVSGSTHKTGYYEISLDHTEPFRDDPIPAPAESPQGFAQYVTRQKKHPPTDIKRLIIVPTPTPQRIKALGREYETFYDEIRFTGAVHESGSITVTLEEVYVLPDPDEGGTDSLAGQSIT